jgi:hypothetical protein
MMKQQLVMSPHILGASWSANTNDRDRDIYRRVLFHASRVTAGSMTRMVTDRQTRIGLELERH